MHESLCRLHVNPFTKSLILGGAMALAVACDSTPLGSPTSPSAGVLPSSSAASVDALARDGGRMVVDITGTNWSGECTVQRHGTRGRLKAVVRGQPNTLVVAEFWVDGSPTPVSGYTNNRGTLRTSGITRSMDAGTSTRCDVTQSAYGVVATTGDFNAP